MGKLIKHVLKQEKIVKEKDPENEGEFIEKKVFLNNVISYYDHNGRLRHLTEDELKKMSQNLNDVLKELSEL